MPRRKLRDIWRHKKSDQHFKVKLLLWFSIAYMVLLSTLAIIQRNFEFVYYISIIVLLTIATSSYYHRFYLSYHIIGGLSLLGFLHIMGGVVFISGERLYDIYLIGSIFRYDNLVHMFGSAMATVVAYNMLRPHINKSIRHNPVFYGLLLVLIASGVGAFNEIIEFFAVAILKAQGVGGYVNNALDLVFNLIGATLASMYIFALQRRKRRKPDIVLKTRRQL